MQLDLLRQEFPNIYEQAKQKVVFIESFPSRSEGMGTNYCIDLIIQNIFESQLGHYKIDGGEARVDELVRQEISRMEGEGFVHVRYRHQDRRRAAHSMR